MMLRGRLRYNFLNNNNIFKVLFSTNGIKNNNYQTPKQILDDPQIIASKVKQLSSIIKNSKKAIFFTGAGISTSLGIPDYRSGSNTIIKTGPGLWNRSQQQLQIISSKRKVQNTVDLVIPSLTHMSIKTLIQHNIFKHIVSQNTDGLHLRSGIKKDKLSELHGNRNLEYCIKCEKKYLRDFRALKHQNKHFKPGEKRDHFTGRYCQNCNGELHDSIVYFGEKLPKEQLLKAFNQAAKSDLCIAIGSSLTVRPSSNVPLMPLQYNPQGKLVIMNIQQTPLDSHATLKINGFCDVIFEKLMKELQINILPYKIQRYITISIQRQYEKYQIQVKGIDQHHFNFSFIKCAKIINENQEKIEIKTKKNYRIAEQQQTTQLKNKFIFDINDEMITNSVFSFQNHKIQLSFFGTLLPNLNISLEQIFRQQNLNYLIGKQSKDYKISLEQGHFKEWKIQQV